MVAVELGSGGTQHFGACECLMIAAFRFQRPLCCLCSGTKGPDYSVSIRRIGFWMDPVSVSSSTNCATVRQPVSRATSSVWPLLRFDLLSEATHLCWRGGGERNACPSACNCSALGAMDLHLGEGGFSGAPQKWGAGGRAQLTGTIIAIGTERVRGKMLSTVAYRLFFCLDTDAPPSVRKACTKQRPATGLGAGYVWGVTCPLPSQDTVGWQAERVLRPALPLFPHQSRCCRPQPPPSQSERPSPPTPMAPGRGGGGGWHKASVFGCLPLAVPIGLSPLFILTLCGMCFGCANRAPR